MLEKSFQLKTFQLFDLSNCLFQLLACPKSVIKKSLMKNVAHNVVIKQNRKTSALSKFHRLRAIGDNKWKLLQVQLSFYRRNSRMIPNKISNQRGIICRFNNVSESRIVWTCNTIWTCTSRNNQVQTSFLWKKSH